MRFFVAELTVGVSRGRSYLERAGIDQVKDVRAMSDEQLIAVEGVGPKTLKDIRARLSQ